MILILMLYYHKWTDSPSHEWGASANKNRTRKSNNRFRDDDDDDEDDDEDYYDNNRRDNNNRSRDNNKVVTKSIRNNSNNNNNNNYDDRNRDRTREKDKQQRDESYSNNRDRDREGRKNNSKAGGRSSYIDDEDDIIDMDRGDYNDRGRDNSSRANKTNNNNTKNSSDTKKWNGVTGGRDTSRNNNNNSYNKEENKEDRLNNNNNNNYRSSTGTSQQSNRPSSAFGGGGGSAALTSQLSNNANSTISVPIVPVTTVPPNLTDMRNFLTSPLPKNCGILQCYIRRNKSGTNKLYPVYSLYLKDGDVFLMTSKKKPQNKTSNYLITMDQNDMKKTGRGYLGKLRSNFVGTEFQIFDNGLNPKDTDPEETSDGKSVRLEMGSIIYAANVLGSRGPRKMQVALPGLDEEDHIIPWKDGSCESNNVTNNSNTTNNNNYSSDDILTRMKERNLKDLNYLINKPPRWNEQVGAYVLNFNGRVTMASVKNFQLVDPDEQNAVVLQFGRVGKDDFTMDLQYPISPFQAFAVTLSSFDSKIACD